MFDDGKLSRGGGRARVATALAMALLGSACSSEDATVQSAASSGTPPDTACKAGEWLDSSGACVAAGIQEGGCHAGERSLDGACRPAGIAPEGCGAGFMPTDDRACAPILPTAPCAPGEMALPGEPTCHALLADCGKEPWADAPSDPTTTYVDGSYAGSGSDGSQAKPYKTIQAAIDAAMPGAIVAVAAGTYTENIIVAGKPVIVSGRCPEMVELVGGDPAAIELGVGAAGSRVRSLAIRGTHTGIAVTGAQGVVIEHVWIHDAGQGGLWVQNVFAPAEATFDQGLIEGTSQVGIYVGGASATVNASVVRDVAEGGAPGDGISAEGSAGQRAQVQVTASLIERAHEAGVYANLADVTVEDSVIRDNVPVTATGMFGVGVGAEATSTLRLRRSVLSGNRDFAVFGYGSEIAIEDSVLRDTEAAKDGMFGRGIDVERSDASTTSTLTVSGSVIDNNCSAGIFVGGTTSTIESTIIRRTRPRPSDGTVGMGIDAESPGTSTTVRFSVIEQNTDTGIYVYGGEARIEGTLVRDTAPRPGDLLFGRGIEVDPYLMPVLTPAKLVVQSSRVEHSTDFGIYVGASDATIESTVIDDTLPRASTQEFGRGVGVEALFNKPATTSIAHSVISRSHDFGVLVLDSQAVLDGVLIRDTMTAADGTYGDGAGLLHEVNIAPPSLRVTGGRIEQSARAGISNFGGTTLIGSTVLECNPVQLDGEANSGFAPGFEDMGANVCGCKEAEVACAVLSASLEPPKAAGNH